MGRTPAARKAQMLEILAGVSGFCIGFFGVWIGLSLMVRRFGWPELSGWEYWLEGFFFLVASVKAGIILGICAMIAMLRFNYWRGASDCYVCGRPLQKGIVHDDCRPPLRPSKRNGNAIA
jgi:hypothetical protein